MPKNKHKANDFPHKSKTKKKRTTHEHHYNAFMVAGLFSFPVIAFMISPFFHELFHLFVLKYYGCSYWVDFQSSIFRGLYATIYHHCTMNSTQLALLYLSGVVGTLAIGLCILIIDWYLSIKDYLEYSIFTSFIAMGFLFSPVIYFFSGEGDLINAFSVLNLSVSPLFPPLFGFTIILLSLIYFWLNLKYTSEKELLEEEKEGLIH